LFDRFPVLRMRVSRLYSAPSLLAAILLIFGLAGCPAEAPVRYSADINELLARGGAYVESLTQRGSAELSDAQIVQLGYVERARLGLGSPFRLIAFVQRDTRIEEADRRLLSYGILALALEGRTYEVDPAVLDLLRLKTATSFDMGQRHLQLIERVIETAPTASSGERAVRIGYGIADAERVTAPVPPGVITQVAALVSDRRRSQRDAMDLLRTATYANADPLELLEAWRRERRFRVERPAQTPTNLRWEAFEARRGAQLAQELRLMSQTLGAATVHFPRLRGRIAERPAGWLSAENARRLAQIGREHNYPAQAPVAVAVMMNRSALNALSGPEPGHADAIQHFATEAINEERFAAEYNVLRSAAAVHDVQLSLVALQAATIFRVWNQEEPWFPGDPAPSVRDVVARFGLEAIEFDASVPASWRPYYTRMLAYALSDLRSVAPTVSLRELTFHIGPLPPERRALALHQPRFRRIILPPHTGAGTIAHEIAHELDRQLARRRYGLRHAYATDLGAEGRGDRITRSVNSLSAAFGPAPGDTLASAHATRAAEIFARGFDWFVAILLARDGRVGGYLSSFQDPAITGYGTTRGQEVGFTAVPALLELLENVAPVGPEARQWSLERFGPNRSVSAEEIVSSLRQAGSSGAPHDRLEAIAQVREKALGSLDATACRLTGLEDLRRLVDAQRALIHEVSNAAARGVVIDAVRSRARSHTYAWSGWQVDAWLSWRLAGAPEPADSSLHVLAPVADELLVRWEALMPTNPVGGDGFRITPVPTFCRGNPFLAAGLPAGPEAPQRARAAVLAPPPAETVPPFLAGSAFRASPSRATGR
jgi:hypothetical protein